MTEADIADVANYANSQRFSAQEKAAIHYADVLAGDHTQASEDLFDELREYFTEPEIIDLGFRIVTFLGYGRLIRALGLEIGKTCAIS